MGCCLDIVVRCLRYALEIISRVIFDLIIYRGNPHNPLPPINNLVLLESATALATKIRQKKLTSEEIVRSFITRIKEINPVVNCVVDECFDDAIKEAKEVDEVIRSGTIDIEELAKTKPFYGVPFSTKDCIMVKGLHQTAGLWSRRDFVAKCDADVVAIMRKAGAIALCVTNVSELCMWWESSNNIYGKTLNPYRTCRIVGGSSGGEGCIQASCGSPFGIGSDIGGSIRMPAFFNGIFGHKPTYGIVSNMGQEPVAVAEAQEFLVTGPMCRFTCDLIPMLKVLAGNNVHLLKLEQKVDIKKLKYFYMEDIGNAALVTPVHPELKNAQLKIVTHLEKAYGIKARKITIKRMKYAVEIYLAKLGNVEGASSFCEELVLKKGSLNVWLELFKWTLRVSPHTLPGILLGMCEKLGVKGDSEEYAKLVSMCNDIVRELKDLLGDDGVLLFPSHSTPAPFHGQPLFRPMNFIYTGIINMLKFPATQCPLGLGIDGVPLGIQVIANHYNDHLTLAVASELEKAFGGWVCPSQVP